MTSTRVPDDVVEASLETIKRPALAVASDGIGSSRRGSGSIPNASGGNTPYHSRTELAEVLPHPDKNTLGDSLRKYESLFTLTPQRMRMIVDAFEEVLQNGLKEHGQIVPMIPAWVFGWPTGKEVGDYLAIDLGGTNLRVCLVTLAGGGKFEITQTKYRLSEEQKIMEGQLLFDFCAESLATFIHSSLASGVLKPGQDIPMGFTFSYPCHQDRIDHGVLIRWTKGFGNPNVEGFDVTAMFDAALKRHHVPVKLTALVNDTTGALIASHYVNPRTRMGVILGTGCNAAYMEKVGNIPKLKGLGLPDDCLMAINCEWGAFDSFDHLHLPRTKYDEIIDKRSNKPGEQAFEKCISGRYLGEIFRLVLMELIDEGTLFLGQNTNKLEKAYSFDTAYLSMMESDMTHELITVVGVFAHFYQVKTTLQERQFFKSLARLIGLRAARLSSCGMAAIVKKCGILDEGCSIGIDGSLYNMYPGFKERIHGGLVDIFGDKGNNIVTRHAEDGSGLGSAIIAAMTKERKDVGLYVNL